MATPLTHKQTKQNKKQVCKEAGNYDPSLRNNEN
jgi:hypothetical protein